MIKAAFFDFDWTLYSHATDCVPKSTVEAIRLMNQKGIKSFIATGRCKKELSWFDLGGADFYGYVFNNGQIVLDKENNVLFSDPIQGILKEELLKTFYDNKIAINLVTKDDIYLNFAGEEAKKVYTKFSSPLPDVHDYHGEEIYMASIFTATQEEREEVNKFHGVISSWVDGAVDVFNPGSCKATGIQKVLDILQIDKSEIISFGDSSNDEDMMKMSGISVAMGNANDLIKSVSSYITDDIDQDGIYNACKHFNLI